MWNCQGLGSDLTVRALHGLIRRNRPTAVFLMETKMRSSRLEGLRKRLGFCKGFDVAPVGRAGGLSLWWDTSVEVEILSSSSNVICSQFQVMNTGDKAHFTWVYGTPYREDKNVFWHWMENSLIPTTMPWFCGGDFNEYLWSHEKRGVIVASHNRPRFLHNFMTKMSLFDLGFNGPSFTWRGRARNGDLIQERIDRALANATWQSVWPNTIVSHGAVLGSDHCPLIINTDPKRYICKKLFKFEAYWAKEDESYDLVERSWNQLQQWSKQKFQKDHLEVQQLIPQLEILQENWEDNVIEIQHLTARINALLENEESYWKQRSRIKWLMEGDANTAFFHQTTIQRRRMNHIHRIKNSDGLWVETPILVRHVVDNYFKDLFTSGGTRDWGDILNCVLPVVSDEANVELCSQITVQEVKDAVFQMGGTKAPGPDGFPGIFYHSYWETICNDVQGIAADFLRGTSSPMPLNLTHIALIPKIPNPESVSQFRPIGLCNFSYKILSKVMANRLQPHMAAIISSSQNAFIPGRQIQDNLIIAHEIFHYLKLKKSKKHFDLGVKLDMNKAYDRVEWDFLEAVMLKMGFAESWVNLIMSCVRSVELSVLINGQPGHKFKPSRGLRAIPPMQPSPRLGGKKKWPSSGAAQARGGCGTHLLGLARRQVLPEVQNEGGYCSATVSATVTLQYRYSTSLI
ncbi:unnamed protein product [Prunus armeniaca]|uniref:Uncharacterized protein n=1 Tax=Prunus armeniaca TaxID=36596 RepID=A0A6J5U1H3_PRUAR|nr:unnamed protein product [Prunus armeniaca]